MKISHRKGLIDRESFVAQYISLAVFTIGVASTLGSDDLLAAFAAGTAISWDGHFNTHTEDELFSSVIDLVLNCACFIYIGAWLPFDQYNNDLLGITPWKLVLLFIAFLALRRIPALLLLYKWIPDVTNWREALFCGHFGPMGVGAIFISTLAINRLSDGGNNPADQEEILSSMLHPIVSFVVLCSILIHGLSIPAFWFGRKAASRTLSFSIQRTRTSRTLEASPDWLLWARRVPGIKGGPDDNHSVNRDIESGPASPSRGSARANSPGEPSSKAGSQTTILENEAERAGFIKDIEEVDGKGKGTGVYTAKSVCADASPSTSEIFTPLHDGEGTEGKGDNPKTEARLGYASVYDKKEIGEDMKREVYDLKLSATAGVSTATTFPSPSDIAQQEEKQVRFAQ